MPWARMLAYVTGTMNQALLVRDEYLVAENHILKTQIKGRMRLSEDESVTETQASIGPGGQESISISLSVSGLIDEVEVYKRVLTATEIQAIFSVGNRGKCKPR